MLLLQSKYFAHTTSGNDEKLLKGTAYKPAWPDWAGYVKYFYSITSIGLSINQSIYLNQENP